MTEQQEIVRVASAFASSVCVALALLVVAGCSTSAPTAVSAAPDASPDACGIHDSPAPADAGADWHWTTLASLQEARQNAFAAEFDGSIYVFGGFGSASELLSSVERYDPTTNAWTAAPAMPTVQCCAGAARVGNEIAVVGGYLPDVSAVTSRLMLFNPSTGSWRDGPPMPTARANVMVAQWHGSLAVIGGRISQGGAPMVTGVVELYDPLSQTWSTAPLTITAREAGVAVSDGTQLVVAGGYTQGSLYGDPIVEILAGCGVVNAPSLQLARGQLTGGSLSGAVVTAGGWGPAGDSASTEVLAGVRSAWQEAPDMPTARSGVAGAVVAGMLVTAGGAQYRPDGAQIWQRLSTVEALLP